jgi:ribosomal protein S18 acetylase RimI-like enzyme
MPDFRVEVLSPSHDRTSFCCGKDPIDKYFRETVKQDIKRGLANCFAAVKTATGRLAGLYTLTSSSIPLTDIPEDLRKGLPHSLPIGVALIGWLGRHVDFRGRGLGEALLFDAIKRIASADVASHAIIVDPIDDSAVEFYRSFGFVGLAAGREGRMYIPVATARKVIGG